MFTVEFTESATIITSMDEEDALQYLSDTGQMGDICNSCRGPLDYPSGDGCAAMDKHENTIGYLVVTDVVEQEDGGATYTFDVDEKVAKQVAQLGLRLTLTCAAYGLDIEDAFQSIVDRGKYLAQEETEAIDL
jgi:hypothetical protein